MNISISPIGYIKSNFDNSSQAARQPAIDGSRGVLILNERFVEGLDGLAEFSHIIAIYHFHLQQTVSLRAKPCFDPTTDHGIFASRYPTRPNHIGISILTLDRIIANRVYCSDIDVINNTPLLDIKPYVKQFDRMDDPKSGWYDEIDWAAQKLANKSKTYCEES